jgi:hypothetical protein
MIGDAGENVSHFGILADPAPITPRSSIPLRINAAASPAARLLNRNGARRNRE